MGIDPEIQAALLDPFIDATTNTLRDMAACDACVRGVTPAPRWQARGDVTALLNLRADKPGVLILSLPMTTATALAERLLTEAGIAVEAQLVRDSVGEIANVITGQAKALTHGSDQTFNLGLPMIVGNVRPTEYDDLPCYEIDWTSDLGDFSMFICKQT
jgi:CheY-specific phosphatase CheX